MAKLEKSFLPGSVVYAIPRTVDHPASFPDEVKLQRIASATAVADAQGVVIFDGLPPAGGKLWTSGCYYGCTGRWWAISGMVRVAFTSGGLK